MSKTIEKIIVGVLVIFIFGIGSFVIAGLGDSQPKVMSSDAQYISLEQAKTIALSTTEGVITEAVLEKKNGVSVYTIEITKDNQETEITINPTDGSVLSTETDTEEEITREDINSIQKTMTESKAGEIALSRVPGTVINIDIEKENGKILYNVEVRDGNGIAEIEIDAETGAVLEVEREDDDEEDE